MKTLDRLLLATIIILGLICFFWRLQEEPVTKWDEQTNIQVVKDTVASQEFFTLKLGDKHFLEKPPLWYWLQIPLIQVLGESQFVFRLTSVASGIALLILLYKFVSARSSKTRGFLAVFILLLTPILFIQRPLGLFSTHTLRSADLDALQLLLIFAAFVFLFAKRKSTIKLNFSFLLLGLAFLTKGPFAIFLLVLNSYFAKLQGYSLKHILLGWAIFLATILPWLLFMYLNFPAEFLNGFFGYHLVARTLTALEGHYQPWYFYFGVFLNPILNPTGFIFILNSFWIFKTKMHLQAYQKYSLILVFTTLLLFSLTQTKLAWYILPVYPFIVIVLMTSKFTK